MNQFIYLRLILFVVLEIASACGVTFWIASLWRKNPEFPTLKMMRHPHRFWFALGLAVIPAIFGRLIIAPLLMSLPHYGTSSMWLPVSMGLSLFYGILYALSACCCAAPRSAEEPFQPGRILGIAAALIVIPSWFPWYQLPVFLTVHILIPVCILVVARLLIGEPPVAIPEASAPPPVQRRAPTVALIVGFFPSALLMGIFAGAAGLRLSRETSEAVLWAACALSVICCFTASILLFSRKTIPAIVGGIVFLLLNAFIAFFCGCCASFRF